jgi:hypothetical protein
MLEPISYIIYMMCHENIRFLSLFFAFAFNIRLFLETAFTSSVMYMNDSSSNDCLFNIYSFRETI